MEVILLPLATCLCGCCATTCFIPIKPKLTRKISIILWFLSAITVVIATVLMISFQVLSKFEYQYVYSHTARDTALIYKISSLWSGQEDSFLLWALILSILGFFMLRR